jgi:hypothetical protein
VVVWVLFGVWGVWGLVFVPHLGDGGFGWFDAELFLFGC